MCAWCTRYARSFSKCTDAWVLITARGVGAYRERRRGRIFCPRQVVDLVRPTDPAVGSILRDFCLVISRREVG